MSQHQYAQPPFPQQPPRRNHTNVIIAVILICVLLGTAGVVFAAFVLSGSVSATVGATSAHVTYVGLYDDTTQAWILQTSVTPAFCNPALPQQTATCSVPPQTLLNPGDAYRLRATVTNDGPVTIPVVSASAVGSFVPQGVTYPAGGEVLVIVPASASTSPLNVAGTWTKDYTFALPADAIHGGTLTVVVTLSG